jgi:cysteine desulfurase
MISASNSNSQDKVYYLDYQATTPCDPRVVEKMIPYFTEHFGNPHSRNHYYGWTAEEAIEVARGQVAHLIGANPKEIVFTSGATESNNLALKGVLSFYKETKNHIITTVTEHKCVLDSCRNLEEQGFKVTYLPVKPSGLVDLDDLRQAITDKTVLVSIMAVHNEIGVIQPLKEIGAICRERGVFFHTDAAQAAGKIPLDVEDMNIDLMSISGHKLYGPKGVGALFVRRRPRVRVLGQINGGGQERGMRSGTLPTPLCVGFGEACAIAEREMAQELTRLKAMSDHFIKTIFNELPEVYLNGDRDQRFPGNINISFAFVEGEGLMMGLKDLAISSGSACTSASLEPSYVLRALGVGEDLAHTSLRIGLGRFTTLEEVDHAATRIIHEVKRLRDMSPLWEMAQEGIDITQIKWAEH